MDWSWFVKRTQTYKSLQRSLDWSCRCETKLREQVRYLRDALHDPDAIIRDAFGLRVEVTDPRGEEYKVLRPDCNQRNAVIRFYLRTPEPFWRDGVEKHQEELVELMTRMAMQAFMEWLHKPRD